jgi:hypothetical protein
MTGDANFMVVGIMLKHVTYIMRRVPVIRHLTIFRDKLVRLHIRGNLSQPPVQLIKKAPVRDISDGFKESFFAIAKSGGKLSDGVLTIIGHKPHDPNVEEEGK